MYGTSQLRRLCRQCSLWVVPLRRNVSGPLSPDQRGLCESDRRNGDNYLAVPQLLFACGVSFLRFESALRVECRVGSLRASRPLPFRFGDARRRVSGQLCAAELVQQLHGAHRLCVVQHHSQVLPLRVASVELTRGLRVLAKPYALSAALQQREHVM